MELLIQSVILFALLFTLGFLVLSMHQKTRTERDIGIFLQRIDSLKTRGSTSAPAPKVNDPVK